MTREELEAETPLMAKNPAALISSAGVRLAGMEFWARSHEPIFRKKAALQIMDAILMLSVAVELLESGKRGE